MASQSPSVVFSRRLRLAASRSCILALTSLICLFSVHKASGQFFQITSPTPVTVTAGSNFDYQITTSTPAASYGMTGQPSWLSINTMTGLLSGVAPGTPGVFSVNLSAFSSMAGSTFRSLTINVVGSTNANLSALSLPDVAISPTFSSNTTNYTANVASSFTSVTVQPAAAQTNATIQVRVNSGTYSNVASGAFSGALPLNPGGNVIDVRVTAQDGTTTKTYTVTVTRAVSSNADLSALSLSGGTLSPAFLGATTNYTASVPNAVATLSVTPTASQSDAAVQVRVNGGAFSGVPSGNASDALALNVGSNTVDIRVTAQDGSTTKTYTVTVTREAPSSNADLSSLSLSAGTLSPEFDPSNGHYNATVAGTVSSVSVTAVPADPGAAIEFIFGGFTVGTGNASGLLDLKIGANPIQILVTAQDGVTTRLYSMTLTRADIPYNPVVNDRFSAGFPTNPFSNTNATFAGLGYDWSGVGWSISNPIYGFALLTPRHYAAAVHVGFGSALGSARALGFFGSNGVTTIAAATNEFGEAIGSDTGVGVVVGRSFDSAVGLLASAPPRAATLARYAVLDLNPVSGTDLTHYIGLQVFTYGRNNFDGTSSPQVASTTIRDASAGLSIGSGGTYFITGRTNAAQLQDGSSGSPAFHGWTNPNGVRELALLGVNSFNVLTGLTQTANIMSFFGTSAAIQALNNITVSLGYAVRVVGNPSASWVGGAGAGGGDLFQATNWSSNTLPETFSLFNAASAAQRSIMVNSSGAFRGIYFRATPGDNGFAFAGSNILAIGRGGIVNYDDSRQIFNAPLRVFEDQVWDSGPGGLTLRNLEIGSPAMVNGQLTLLPCLLEVTGVGSTVVNGTISGPGSLSVSSGDLVLNGTNSYTGTTWVNGGRLIVNGSVAARNAIINEGALLLGSSGSLPTDATVNLAGSGAVLDISSNNAGGLLVGSLKGVAGTSVNLGTNNLFVSPTNPSTTFAGVISNAGGLIKLGTGTFTLSGANSYSGTTTVMDGVLHIAKADFSTTIAPTEITVAFTSPPANGVYELLPGPLDEASLATATVTGLSADSTATLENSPNLKLTVAVLAPIMTIEQPAGIVLSNDAPANSFGNVPTGVISSERVFTIRNAGNAALSSLQIFKTGTHTNDFQVTGPQTTSIAGADSVTFSVCFAPSSGGSRNAQITITSNDTNRSPFVVNLSGFGISETLDTDADGLNDAAEFGMTALGFDFQTPQAALVANLMSNANTAGLYTSNNVATNPTFFGLFSEAQVESNRNLGFAEGKAEITNNLSRYSLYTETSIMDLRMGGVMVQRQGSNAVVTFQPQTTTDLGIVPFTNNGPPITNQVLMPGNKGFIRIRANP